MIAGTSVILSNRAKFCTVLWVTYRLPASGVSRFMNRIYYCDAYSPYLCHFLCITFLKGPFHSNITLSSSSQQMMSHETHTPLVIALWRWTGHLSQYRPPTPSLCTVPALLLLSAALSETRWLSFGLYCIFVFSAYFHKSNKWTVTPRALLKSSLAVALNDSCALFLSEVAASVSCRNVPLIKFAPKTS